jgi:hypothetical protein
MAGQDLTTCLLDVFCERCGDLRVVHNAGVRGVQRPEGGAMRFDLAQPLRFDQLQSENAVRYAASVQFFQPWQLCWLGCDDDLAAALVRNTPLVAETHEGRWAGTQRPAFSEPGA